MSDLELLAQPVALPEGIDPHEYVIATYLVSFPSTVSVPKLAPALAMALERWVDPIGKGIGI